MTTTRRWLVWIPVLMVASLIYWTVALGLGGMSLMEVSSLSGSLSVNDGPLGVSITDSDSDSASAVSPIPPHDGYEPIVVHLEESVEPEDVDDNPGCGLSGGSAGAGAESASDSQSDSDDAAPVVQAAPAPNGSAPLVY